MLNLPTPIVSTDWVLGHVLDPGVVLVDCRFTLGQPDAGRERYQAAHIPGAVHFDLERDLSGPEAEHGGRHPLPDPGQFAARLGQVGIEAGTAVVAYDETGEFAARLWWLLRYLGHDQVAILDGGFPAWQAAGLPITAAPALTTPREFIPRPRPELLATMEEVRDRSPGTVVVDARAAERFAGQPHPLDAKAGHIPGAINRFWKESLHADGTWKTAAEQAERLGDLKDAPDLILHCGSGVTACPNLVALAQLGVSGARLYVGSWSDWCTYPDNPIETA